MRKFYGCHITALLLPLLIVESTSLIMSIMKLAKDEPVQKTKKAERLTFGMTFSKGQ